ncbi:MAG: glutathione S-transferase family protein [Parvularculaceae bacterium]
MAKPVLYYCPRTRADTAMWMNAELGEICDIKIVNLKTGAHKEPAYLAVNPMGKVPALTHDGAVVTEAAAICAHLADVAADKGFAPKPGDPQRGAYYRWLFFSPSVIEPMMLDKLGQVKRENTGAAGHGNPEDVLATINGALSKTPYLLGDKATAADIVLGSTLHFATMFGAIEKKGVIAEYVDRMIARPAFARMQEISAKYAAEIGF